MPWGAPVSPCVSQKIPKFLKIFFGAYMPWGAPVTPRGSQKILKNFFQFFSKYLRCLHALDSGCVSVWFEKKSKKIFEIFFNILEVTTCRVERL